jgi:membrane associated rhomboid family serine protease
MERWLARLERRFGRYAIPNLTIYLIALQAVGFVLDKTKPQALAMMVLDRDRVLAGEVWRLFSYLLIPQSDNPLWILFALYFLYIIGTALESEWGAFKYTLFWIVGILLTTLGAFVFGVPATNSYLMAALFLAFATLWPDFQILLMFVLPVKVKWLAWLSAIWLAYEVVGSQGWMRILPILAVGNYLLFFAETLVDRLRSGVRLTGRAGAKSAFRAAAERPKVVRRCKLCGVTDEDPDVEFRVCMCEKCGGKPTEFCLEHARNH